MIELISCHSQQLFSALNCMYNMGPDQKIRLGSAMVQWQTWGKLIVNANALLMHYFFQVIQGND